jgi:16S rRNA (uracil1498-N3)-methyltransferase
MKIHRFYVPDIELKHDFWLHDERLLHQWNRVLRFRAGQQVVLFDGLTHDRLYKIDEIKPNEAHLLHVTDFARKVPGKDIYLLWSLLKKDKNDWVLQKCTELGVSHFVPLLADRSEKTGFNVERAEKIVIEAAEQCGRSDIPSVRQPQLVSTAIESLKDKVSLLVAEQDAEQSSEQRAKGTEEQSPLIAHDSLLNNSIGVLIGPEGGWSDAEKQLFADKNVQHLNLHDFTLRAETAAVTAVSEMMRVA